MAYQIEHTDTFGGESNYCWVNRWTIEPGKRAKNERLSLVRQAKALTGLSGHPCQVADMGDLIEIRPRNMAQIVFVSWIDSDEAVSP